MDYETGERQSHRSDILPGCRDTRSCKLKRIQIKTTLIYLLYFPLLHSKEHVPILQKNYMKLFIQLGGLP